MIRLAKVKLPDVLSVCLLDWKRRAADRSGGFGIRSQQCWFWQPRALVPVLAIAFDLTRLGGPGRQPIFHGRQQKDHAPHQSQAEQSQGGIETLAVLLLTLKVLNWHSAIAADQQVAPASDLGDHATAATATGQDNLSQRSTLTATGRGIGHSRCGFSICLSHLKFDQYLIEPIISLGWQ